MTSGRLGIRMLARNFELYELVRTGFLVCRRGFRDFVGRFAGVLRRIFFGLTGFFVGFGSLLVALASIIGLVKALAFENHAGAGTDEPDDLCITITGAWVVLFELFSCRIGDGLEQLGDGSAFLALVFVRGHGTAVLYPA